MKGLKKMFAGDSVTSVASGIVGGVGANFITNKAKDMIEKKSPGNGKWAPALAVLVGLYASKQKNAMIKYAGLGMTAVGGMKLVGSLVPSLAGVYGLGDSDIAGIYDEVLRMDQVSGTDAIADGGARDSIAGDESLGGIWGDESLGNIGDDFG